MARKPNYSFERNNRAKAKAAKREAKRQAKLLKQGGAAGQESDDSSALQPERTEDLNESRSDGAIPTEGN